MLVNVNFNEKKIADLKLDSERLQFLNFESFLVLVRKCLFDCGILTDADQNIRLLYEDDEGDKLALKNDDDLYDMLTILPASTSSEEMVANVFVVSTRKPPKVAHVPKGISFEQERTGSATDSLLGRLNPDYVSVDSLRNLAILGSGQCGTVYKTLDIVRDRLMAVKCIALDVDLNVQEKILAEMEILRKCHSPYIIEFYAALFMENQFSICMEFMDGGSLDRFGKLPANVLTPVACSMARGLCYLWEMKIMHRDVKPSNVLVNSQGVVKLCDFGVSIQLQASIAKTYVGTNAYMAPERLLGGEYRIYSDVWSLGLSLLEMALGRFPYDTTSPTEVKPMDLMEKIVSDDVPLSTNELIEYNTSFRELMITCVSKQPEQRLTPNQLINHQFIIDNFPIDCDSIGGFVLSKIS